MGRARPALLMGRARPALLMGRARPALQVAATDTGAVKVMVALAGKPAVAIAVMV